MWVVLLNHPNELVEELVQRAQAPQPLVARIALDVLQQAAHEPEGAAGNAMEGEIGVVAPVLGESGGSIGGVVDCVNVGSRGAGGSLEVEDHCGCGDEGAVAAGTLRILRGVGNKMLRIMISAHHKVVEVLTEGN